MILEHINKIPPFLCIAMARKGTKPIPQREIAKKAKLSIKSIAEMSSQLKWDEWTAEQIDAVSRACRVDLNNQRDAWQYLKKTFTAKTPFSHLGPNTRAKVFKLFQQLKDSR